MLWTRPNTASLLPMAWASANTAGGDAWNVNVGAFQPCKQPTMRIRSSFVSTQCHSKSERSNGQSIVPSDLNVFLRTRLPSKSGQMCSCEACVTAKICVKPSTETRAMESPQTVPCYLMEPEKMSNVKTPTLQISHR